MVALLLVSFLLFNNRCNSAKNIGVNLCMYPSITGAASLPASERLPSRTQCLSSHLIGSHRSTLSVNKNVRYWIGSVLLCGSLALLLSLSTKANAQIASPEQIRINHFIYIIQENHSFDNYFGTYAKADHIPPGIKLADRPPN